MTMNTSTTPKLQEEQTLSPTSVVVASASSSSCSRRNANASSSSDRDPYGDGDKDHVHHHDCDLMVSPTSVAMVSSASSSSLLPSAATTTPTPGATAAAIMAKPFFVMDWLEEINPRDLELARLMIQTPTKKMKNKLLLQQPTLPHQTAQSLPSSPPQPSRSSIALPTLIHDDDEDESSHNNNCSSSSSHKMVHDSTQEDTNTVCRQLYPSAETSTTTPNGVAPSGGSSDGPSSSSLPTMTSAHGSSGNLSSATSVTSVSSAGSQQEALGTPPRASSRSTSSVTALSPSTNASITSTGSKMSPFRKRSIAIGNGWNAKGLHKAKKGSWESALTCWENALEIRTQVLGETHPDVANTCNNIGIALGKLERFDAAIEVLERALELRAKHYGTRQHVEVAATLHNIGNVLHAAKDCAGAIQCFWDAKLLQEQLLGPNHVQVARACVAIGNVYYEAMQYEDAREAYYDALHIFANASLPQMHPEVLAIQADLQDIERLCCAHQHHQHQHALVQDYHHPQMGHYASSPQGV